MRLRKVEVIWEDACSRTKGWEEIEEARAAKPIVTMSSGFLLKRDKKVVIIAQTLNETGVCTDTIVIPTKMVKKVRYLK